MRDSAIVVALAVSVLGLHGVAFGESPPEMNIGPSCDAAASGSVVVGRDKEACLVDERAAKDGLTKNWDGYDRAARTQCVGLNRTGGPPSYVELLSCLEVMRDAKVLEKDNPLTRGSPTPSTTGAASAASGRGHARRR
jgi:hypothetical protein